MRVQINEGEADQDIMRVQINEGEADQAETPGNRPRFGVSG